jgi:hypothetical protein
MADNVQHPAHYSGDGLECIDVIEAALGAYGFRMFCLGNVLKYSWRHRLKNGPEDLAKADVYRAWAIAGTSRNRAAPSYEEAAVQHHATEAPMPPAVAELITRAEEDDGPDGLKAGEAYREHGDGTP